MTEQVMNDTDADSALRCEGVVGFTFNNLSGADVLAPLGKNMAAVPGHEAAVVVSGPLARIVRAAWRAGQRGEQP